MVANRCYGGKPLLWLYHQAEFFAVLPTLSSTKPTALPTQDVFISKNPSYVRHLFSNQSFQVIYYWLLLLLLGIVASLPETGRLENIDSREPSVCAAMITSGLT